MSLYSREMMMKEYENVENEFTPNDLCFTFVEHLNTFACLNKKELHEQMRFWKEKTKSNDMYVDPEHKFDFTIKGVPYYVLVIESDKITNGSKAGLFLFDNQSWSIEGLFYCFPIKENRDMVFEYIYKVQKAKEHERKDEIINPATGRWVKRNGPTGMRILASLESKSKEEVEVEKPVRIWIMLPNVFGIKQKKRYPSYENQRKLLECKYIEWHRFDHNGATYILAMDEDGRRDGKEYNESATKLLTKINLPWGRKRLTGNYIIFKGIQDGEGGQTYCDMDLTPQEYIDLCNKDFVNRRLS